MIRQVLPGESDGLIPGTVEIYARVFEHLMFDSAYFEALRQCQRTGTISDSLAGTEKFRIGDTCPIVPGCLTPDLREQWMKDFTTLTSYALEKGLGAEDGVQRSDEHMLSEAIRNLERIASKPRKPQKPAQGPSATSVTPSKADAQRDANKQLYLDNKELASANAALEAKLDRMKTTLGSLTTKIEQKTGEKVAVSDPVDRVSAALRLALRSHSQNTDDNK
ncbi:hypothetical protein AAVH_26434, partial [Aphelenchoides avenae]